MVTERDLETAVPAAMRQAVHALLSLAAAEDAVTADVTTQAVLRGLSAAQVAETQTARAVFIAEAALTFCGGFWLEETFAFLPGQLALPAAALAPPRTTLFKQEGERVAKAEVLAEVRASTALLLCLERIALNGMQHLSGVATVTAEYVAAAEPAALVVSDTRKTLPGYRLLEKYAVRKGGGVNHRCSLADGLLLKDNHYLAAGGLREALLALLRARARAPELTGLPLVVECASLAEVAMALACKLQPNDALLLDNFNHQELTAALKLIKQRVKVEVSGGITLQELKRIKTLSFYIDRVSVGALTHSAPAADISMDLSLAD